MSSTRSIDGCTHALPRKMGRSFYAMHRGAHRKEWLRVGVEVAVAGMKCADVARFGFVVVEAKLLTDPVETWMSAAVSSSRVVVTAKIEVVVAGI